MAHLSESTAALRLFGDDLIPDEITKLLGSVPTTSYLKGQVVRGKKSGCEVIKKTGMWLLQASDRTPENLDSQVTELLGKLTQDLAVWSSLKNQFEIDLYCGLFMEVSNEGAEVSSDTLMLLGVRGIALTLDIYDPIEEIKEHDLCPCGSGETYGNCCKP